MTKTLYEAWAYPIDLKISVPGYGDILLGDHTWVKCPSIKKNFKCWGGTSGDGNRKIVGGRKGNYDISNCYRTNHRDHKDTAGLTYAYNGVCHQTANLYMFPAGQVITPKVRGHVATLAVYGVYGTALPTSIAAQVAFLAWWRSKYYRKCKKKYRLLGEISDIEPEEPSQVFQDIQELYQSRAPGPLAAGRDRHNLQQQEFAIMNEALETNVDYGRIEDLHLELLQARDEIFVQRPRGVALAEAINSAGCEFQKALAGRLDLGRYENMMGTPPGEMVAIVDPRIAEATADQEVVENYSVPEGEDDD